MSHLGTEVSEEITACIRCNACLEACPAVAAPIPIKALNRETLGGPLSPAIAHFAQSCFLCGACVPVCPAHLHRDQMMLWLKMRLLGGPAAEPMLAQAAWAESGAMPAVRRVPTPAPRQGSRVRSRMPTDAFAPLLDATSERGERQRRSQRGGW